MIVITAPTSNIGRQVLAQIVPHAKVRVIARDAARLPPEIRAQVEVVEGSHSDREVVVKAFASADTVFWLVPADPRAPNAEAAYVDFARPGCDAFRAHGIKHVVGVSALGRTWPKDAGYVTATLHVDDAIAKTGVAYRALACATFMDNILRQAAPLRSDGVFYGAVPRGLKMPTCATRDIASIAAGLLLDRSWTGVAEVPVLGPEDLSFDDMAAIMSEELAKPVRYQEIALEQLKGMSLGRGMSEGMAQAMVNMVAAVNEGMNNIVKRTPADGAGTSFRRWCAEVLKPAVMA